jgi:nucleoside-diphosphate-sugar epimerase
VFDLAVINPSIIYGPTLGGSSGLGTSELTLAGLFDGKTNKLSQFFCGHCDVRDVALAHIRAAFLPEAVGNRHIIVSEGKWFSIKRVADILSSEFSPKGYKVKTEAEPKDDPNNQHLRFPEKAVARDLLILHLRDVIKMMCRACNSSDPELMIKGVQGLEAVFE